jgi:hypothetical protein
MPRRSSFAIALAHSLLLSLICIAQNPRPTEKARFDNLLARAEHGDAAAQLKLANAYLGRAVQTGVKVQPSHSEALHWYLAAAKQNNIEALLDLGAGYEDGFFGKVDWSKAVEYYRRAAELGNTDAAVNLTNLYAEGGKGLAKDFDEAARWANCPKPSNSTMQGCESDTGDQLPPPALALLDGLKCDSESGVELTAKIHLQDGSELPYYEVCCHYLPQGPCDAVLIGEVAGRWTNLSDKVGLLGFSGTCGGLMVLQSAHAALHDLCLSWQCSDLDKHRCRPTILEFNGIRYHSVPAPR